MRIGVKKIVLVSLLVIVGLPLLFLSTVAGTIAYDGWRMSKGEYPLADTSEAKIGQFPCVSIDMQSIPSWQNTSVF